MPNFNGVIFLFLETEGIFLAWCLSFENEDRNKNIHFWRPYLKVYGEISWLPIYKMVWNFMIQSGCLSFSEVEANIGQRLVKMVNICHKQLLYLI